MTFQRVWLATSLMAALVMAVSLDRAQDQKSKTNTANRLFSYETEKVADGVYAFISHGPGVGLVSGNSVAVIGDNGVLVVDSGQFPSLTRQTITEIKTLTHQPVRILVNTHWHPDHTTGNSEYKAAFPDIIIVSTEATRRQFSDMRPKFSGAKYFDDVAQMVKTTLQADKDPDGKPLTNDNREYYKELLKEADCALPELKQAKTTPPDMTFRQQLIFYLGKREVEVMFLGRGNTAGDAVIYVPDRKVLMTGDLVVNPTPYALGSFMTEWIQTMKKLQAMDAAVIVPGHGPVEHDGQYMRVVTKALESVTGQVSEAAKQGLTLEETRKKVNLDNFRRAMAGDDRNLNRNFETYFFQPSVERVYREVKEGPLTDEN